MKEEQKDTSCTRSAWAPRSGAVGSREQGPLPDEIRRSIRYKYTQAAQSIEGLFGYPTGKKGALTLGYDAAIINAADPGLPASFCGVGNPFSLFPIKQGSIILDVGCGAGFDMYVAARRTGPEGMVHGVDLTEAMVGKARENLTRSGIRNFEVTHVESETLPFNDKSFDIVLSNGVINLSPEKETLFREIFRVLRPGGRLGFADVVLDKEIPASIAASAESWAAWIGGAVPVGDYLLTLRRMGFSEILFTGMTGFRTSPYTEGALFRAMKSANTSFIRRVR